MRVAQKLSLQVKALPDSPGVYMFKDAAGKIIYIGKAKSLKKRVRSYFGRQLEAKTQVMVRKISAIEYTLTLSEAQAQILEAALVKDLQPRYNIELKDDKSFLWVRISDEKFPLISAYRRKLGQKNDTVKYFGPYPDAALLRQALKVMRRVFGFRSCKTLPDKPCLYFRLKLCPAPCAGKISPKEYQELIRQVRMFLGSKYSALLKRLTRQMQKASKKHKFELAARLRDQINAFAAFSQGGGKMRSLSELEDLKNALGLAKLPLRIEGFDISNISGRQAVGSMVSFAQGLPDKSHYRRFRIKTVFTVDDYAMLREVVRRRYKRLVEENREFPDLVLIDGGKAHLQAAADEIKNLGIDIPLMAFAKGEEHIYLSQKSTALKLEEGALALNLMRRVRDEAHRFALSYHHLLRRKSILQTRGAPRRK